MANELAIRNTGITPAQEWEVMKQQAGMLVKTGFLPESIKTAEQAVAIMLKGRELAVPPMQAFSHIHIIKGKPSCSAELMLALCYRDVPGFKFTVVETDAKHAVVRAEGKGRVTFEQTFDEEDAKKAGLLVSGSSWTKYPGAMYRARATSACLRVFAPDALAGMSFTPEELGAVVDGEGEVIDVKETSPAPIAEWSEGKPTITALNVLNALGDCLYASREEFHDVLQVSSLNDMSAEAVAAATKSLMAVARSQMKTLCEEVLKPSEYKEWLANAAQIKTKADSESWKLVTGAIKMLRAMGPAAPTAGEAALADSNDENVAED